MNSEVKYGSPDLEVAIILLTYNCKEMSAELLTKVFGHTQLNDEVQLFFVDNASTDDTVNFLTQRYPTTQLIEFDENLGFAGGMDKAVRIIEAKYCVLLSCDVELSDLWLEPIIQLFNLDTQIGAIQPKVRSYANKELFEYAGASGGYMDALGFPFCRGRLFNSLEEDNGQYDGEKEVFWGGGCSIVVRREAFLKSGGMDLDFFAHQEEIDMAWRMQLHGYKIMVCPSSVVYHIGGGVLSYNNPFKLYLNSRNNLAMMTKNLPAGTLAWTLFVRSITDALAAFYVLFKQGPRHFFAIIKGHFSFWVGIGKWLAKRKEVPNKKSWNKLKGVYVGSILVDYFIKRRKRFNQLSKFQSKF